MGRPIKKKFFANTNIAATGEGVGGEGVATIARNNTGTLYTTSTTISLTFTAPQIAGGQTASGSVTTNALGNVATVTLADSGSGYTGTPTATVTGGTTGTTATFTITMTTGRQNGLNVTAYIPAKNGGVSAKLADIVKQEASQRYLVRTADGIGQCKLVASNTPTAGQMNLIATDANGSTYWVTKLTARRCILTRRTMSTAYLFATNGSAGWTIASASLGVVSIGSV
jgi:hypothetical protein